MKAAEKRQGCSWETVGLSFLRSIFYFDSSAVFIKCTFIKFIILGNQTGKHPGRKSNLTAGYFAYILEIPCHFYYFIFHLVNFCNALPDGFLHFLGMDSAQVKVAGNLV